MKSKLTFLVLLFAIIGLQAQSPIGIWKTVDDNTGEAKSHIEVYENGGKLYGKIIKLLKNDASATCDKCTGDKKNKPLIGLVILEDLKAVKEYWGKGKIMDPENGKEYGCSIWFEEEKKEELKVRGKHWTGLYRTQTWYKVK